MIALKKLDTAIESRRYLIGNGFKYAFDSIVLSSGVHSLKGKFKIALVSSTSSCVQLFVTATVDKSFFNAVSNLNSTHLLVKVLGTII